MSVEELQLRLALRHFLLQQKRLNRRNACESTCAKCGFIAYGLGEANNKWLALEANQDWHDERFHNKKGDWILLKTITYADYRELLRGETNGLIRDEHKAMTWLVKNQPK